MEQINEEYLDAEDYGKRFSVYYKFQGVIGEGAFGYVVKAVDKTCDELIAVKIIKKVRMAKDDLENFRHEAHLLESLNHPNIVKFRHIKETETKMFLGMELIEGGSLETLLDHRRKEGKKFNELEVSQLMKALLQAVNHTHSKEIVHRDIKPENILFKNPDDLSSLKLVDFGLSTKNSEETEHRSLVRTVGTVLYMAPEVLQKRGYSKPVDIWSCGIIMYWLLTGEHPIYEKKDNEERYRERLLVSEIELPPCFSRLAHSLIGRLLNPNHIERYTAEQSLQHPWITRDVNQQIPLTVQEMFEKFHHEENFREIIKRALFIKIVEKHVNKTELMEGYLKRIGRLSRNAKEAFDINIARRKSQKFEDITPLDIDVIQAMSNTDQDSSESGTDATDSDTSDSHKDHRRYSSGTFEYPAFDDSPHNTTFRITSKVHKEPMFDNKTLQIPQASFSTNSSPIPAHNDMFFRQPVAVGKRSPVPEKEFPKSPRTLTHRSSVSSGGDGLPSIHKKGPRAVSASYKKHLKGKKAQLPSVGSPIIDFDFKLAVGNLGSPELHVEEGNSLLAAGTVSPNLTSTAFNSKSTQRWKNGHQQQQNKPRKLKRFTSSSSITFQPANGSQTPNGKTISSFTAASSSRVYEKRKSEYIQSPVMTSLTLARSSQKSGMKRKVFTTNQITTGSGNSVGSGESGLRTSQESIDLSQFPKLQGGKKKFGSTTLTQNRNSKQRSGDVAIRNVRTPLSSMSRTRIPKSSEHL